MAYMHSTHRSSSEGNDADNPQHQYPTSYSYYNHTGSGTGSRSHHYPSTSPPGRTPPSFRNDAEPRGFSGLSYDPTMHSRTGAHETTTSTSYAFFNSQPPLRMPPETPFFASSVAPPRGSHPAQYEYDHTPFGAVHQSVNPYGTGQQHNTGATYGRSTQGVQPQPVFGVPRATGLDSRPRASDYEFTSSRRHDINLQVTTNSQSSRTYLSPSYAPSEISPSRSPSESGSPTMSVTILNANAPGGHSIREIPITDRDRSKYIRHPTAAESASGWRHGYLKCIFEGCQSPVEPNKVANHLALHIHAKKAHECICGARFGRLSEANRHLEDQSPCQQCHESRRKHKGTRICARCIGSTRASG